MKFNELIIKHKAKTDLSNEKIGSIVGVSRVTIENITKGQQPRIELAVKLIVLFKIPFVEVVGILGDEVFGLLVEGSEWR